MGWNRRYALRSYLRSALWIAPLIAFGLSQLLFRLSNALQIDFGYIPGFAFAGESRQSAMDIDITLNLSFIVFTFGSLLVAIQVAGGQLTPRIIATMLLRDKVIRWVVGLFTFGLLLSVGARNRLDTIPDFIVSLAAILGLLSAIAFFFLIDYAARSLRPVSILWHAGEMGLKVIDDVYPHRIEGPPARTPWLADVREPDRTVAHRGSSAIVLAVNVEALVGAARKAGGIVELVPQVGDFVSVGEPLFRLHGAAASIDDELLRAQVACGRERTLEQDSTFAFRLIVDIAAKALSPAINDPTTAVLAIDQIHRLLRVVGRRHLRDEIVRDRGGEIRLIFRTPNWEEFVSLACTEIRHYGATSVQVTRRLRAMIANLMQTLPEFRRPALQRELDLLDRTVESAHANPEDQALARAADTQGLGGVARAWLPDSRVDQPVDGDQR